MKMKVFTVALVVSSLFLAKGALIPKKNRAVKFALNAIKDELASNGINLPKVTVRDVTEQKDKRGRIFLQLTLTGDYHCNITLLKTRCGRLRVAEAPTCRREYKMMPGGLTQSKPLSEGDQRIKKALNFAVCALNSRDKDSKKHASVFGDLSGATYTEQVVAGMLYRFEGVQLKESKCPNKNCDDSFLSKCTPKRRGEMRTCDLQVLSQPWMTPEYKLMKTTC